MKSREPMNRDRLATKVEWEGGVLAAIEYGIRSNMIEDKDLRAVWKELEERYLALTPIVDRLEEMLTNKLRPAA